MRILICGDRHWSDFEAIRRRLEFMLQYYKLSANDVLVIEGGAAGADRLGRRAAEEMGIAVAEFPAPWDYYGKPAGPIRNTWMLRWGQPDVVLAFHPYLANSRGTKNMVDQAKKKGVEVYVYDAA